MYILCIFAISNTPLYEDEVSTEAGQVHSIKFQSTLEKSMREILQLLQMYLFEKLDLHIMLRNELPHRNTVNPNQITFLLKLTGQQCFETGSSHIMHITLRTIVSTWSGMQIRPVL